jgi:hypothetical protein
MPHQPHAERERAKPLELFLIGEIARAVARLPGRLEFDRDEATRIAEQMYEWYEQGRIGESEVLAQVEPAPAAYRPLKQVIEDAQPENGNWQLSLDEWRSCYLTRSATRRYLEGCRLIGASRTLTEWFSDPAAAADPRPPRRRRDEKRPEIAQAVAAVKNSPKWETARNKDRARIIERHLGHPEGWCSLRTLGRAIADCDTANSSE